MVYVTQLLAWMLLYAVGASRWGVRIVGHEDYILLRVQQTWYMPAIKSTYCYVLVVQWLTVAPPLLTGLCSNPQPWLPD